MQAAASMCDQKQDASTAMSLGPECAELWQIVFDLGRWRTPTVKDWENGAVRDELAALQQRARAATKPTPEDYDGCESGDGQSADDYMTSRDHGL